MMKLISGSLILLLFWGCSHVQSVSVSSIPKKRSQKVRVSADKFIFFLLNFNNDYVNELTEQLASKCPKGVVKGVLTKHELITYFPLVAYKQRVSIEGYCVR